MRGSLEIIQFVIKLLYFILHLLKKFCFIFSRHNVIWWRTRCQALEQENQVLRDTVRHLARTRQCPCQRKGQVRNEVENEIQSEDHHRCHSEFQNDTRIEFQNEARNQFQKRALNGFHTEIQSNFKEAEVEDEPVSDNESLEFQLNDDMIDFLKQSMQHKLELKQKREEEASEKVEEEEEQEVSVQGGAAWMQKRTENAKLLYGESSARILAMETALQTTIDRHKDKARPQYWPNIPLKL